MSDTGRRDIWIKRVECGICEQAFTTDVVPALAKQIARHWNQEHGDELQYSMTPFNTETHVEEHLHGDEYRCRVYDDYLTAYDIIDPDGNGGCGPFAYEYVKNPEAVDVCEDCWRSIKNVDGYRELETSGWRDTYRCDECDLERTVQRRKEENQSLDEYALETVTDGGHVIEDTLHIGVDGLWIPPELREFTAQIVFRTPRGTIQHYQSGGGCLDPYYGMIDESSFGPVEELRDPRNPELAPNRVSIKPQGQDPRVFEVDLDD